MKTQLDPTPRLALLMLLALIAATMTGCGFGGGEACSTASQGYAETQEKQGSLEAAVADEGPYPMAIVISQGAVNSLFSAIASANLPPITLSDSIFGVPVGVTVRPQLPLIQIGEVANCPTCILTSMDFGLDFSIDGVTVGADGAALYSFPLLMEANGLESTRVKGAFQQSQFLELDIGLKTNVSGQLDFLVNEAIDLFQPLITQEVTRLVREEFGETELFELDAWELGDGDVKLLGRGPIISAENKTIVIGMHSNLFRPLSGTVNAAPTLPAGHDIGLQFHPELIQSMVQRMMYEGHVDSSYDIDGTANAQGDQQVTLDKMAASETNSDLLTTGFTLWSTGNSFCGTAGLQADLGLSISEKQLKFSAQNVKLSGGSGLFGDVAGFAGDWVDSPLLSQVIGTSQITVNYNTLKLPNEKQANLAAGDFVLDLGGDGLRLFMDIDGIVDAIVE